MKVPASKSRKAPLVPPLFFLPCGSSGTSVAHTVPVALRSVHCRKTRKEVTSRPCPPSGSQSVPPTEHPRVKASWKEGGSSLILPPPGLLAVPGCPLCREATVPAALRSPAPERRAATRCLAARRGGRLAGHRLLPVASPQGPALDAWPKGRLSGRPFHCVGSPGLPRWDCLRTRGAALRQPQT